MAVMRIMQWTYLQRLAILHSTIFILASRRVYPVLLVLTLSATAHH